MSTAKLVGATVLPNSILLISGIIIWRFWHNKQTRLQAETNELTDEIRLLKKQMADIQTAEDKSPPNKTPASDKGTNPDDTGLFEFLIEDNIRLRNQA